MPSTLARPPRRRNRPATPQPRATAPPRHRAILTGRHFFPALISGPFHHGLVMVLAAATALAATAAVASLLRGGRGESGASLRDT